MTTEAKEVLYEDLSYEVATNMLATETLNRLNVNKTGFDFRGYNTSVPGYICLPVKHIGDSKARREQRKELEELGYRKMEESEKDKYKIVQGVRELYLIPIRDLLEIHNIVVE